MSFLWYSRKLVAQVLLTNLRTLLQLFVDVKFSLCRYFNIVDLHLYL